MGAELIEPFYFGPRDSLFGCLHEPQGTRRRTATVVLCPPMGHEYIRFHRAYRSLAVGLAGIGFATMRFDYYGSGDSAGRSRDASLERWVADTRVAVDELKRRCGRASTCAVGLRIGATVATLATTMGLDVDGLILWDPVVRGGSYLQEIRDLHRQMLQRAHVTPWFGRAARHGDEVLGFPMTKELATSLGAIDLTGGSGRVPARVLLLESKQRGSLRALEEHLARAGTPPDYLHQPTPELWPWVEDIGQIRVPYQLIQSMISWLDRRYP